MGSSNRRIMLIEKPQGRLGLEHFQMESADIPSAKEGEALLRTRYLSLDAANRAWMQGATYRSALEAGQIMSGASIAEVVESKAPHLKAGDLVFADIGWQEYGVAPAKNLRPLPKREPLTHLLSVYGVTGLTAYFGLLRVGRPKEGETVVVSAAGGAVGSLVGQIAKLKGCRAVGIAGGAEKCAWLKDALGFDEAVDYKAGPVFKSLKAAAPKGIDVYFDNVGGDIFEACLFQMNMHGRIACCGAVSSYDGPAPQHGPRGVPGLLVVRRLTVQGFIVMDFDEEREQALAELEGWVKAGKLTVQKDVIEGLDQAPAALIGLLAGENRGKRMIKVA